MTEFLLSVHVLAAIIAVGPVTVAASMFPAAVRRVPAAAGDGRPPAVVPGVLHRVCRVYAAVGVVVPVFGLATASSLHVLGDPWLIASIVLTAAAAAVLAGLVLPGQSSVMSALGSAGQEPAAAERARSAAGRLGMYTGVFNLLWATVTVLMITRPGSTTGA